MSVAGSFRHAAPCIGDALGPVVQISVNDGPDNAPAVLAGWTGGGLPAVSTQELGARP